MVNEKSVNFPKGGEICSFIQFYINETPHMKFAQISVPYSKTIEEELIKAGIKISYESIGFGNRPMLKGLDYEVVGMGLAGITQDTQLKKIIIEENNEEYDLGFNKNHFKNLTSLMNLEMDFTIAKTKLGDLLS